MSACIRDLVHFFLCNIHADHWVNLKPQNFPVRRAPGDLEFKNLTRRFHLETWEKFCQLPPKTQDAILFGEMFFCEGVCGSLELTPEEVVAGFGRSMFCGFLFWFMFCCMYVVGESVVPQESTQFLWNMVRIVGNI